MNLYRTENASYRYSAQHDWAFRDLSLQINKGEFIALVGGPGEGKSSILRFLSGVLPEAYGGEASGNATFADSDLFHPLESRQRMRMGSLTENPENYRLFRNVRRELSFGLDNSPYDRNTKTATVQAVAEKFRLNELLERDTSKLSTGELSRLMLAAAIAPDPDVLLLDNPFGAISDQIRIEMLGALHEMNRARDVTLIVSGLTDKEIGNYAGRVIEVAKGAIVFDGPAKDYLQGRDDSSSSAPRVNPRECSVTVCRIQSLEFTHADSNFKLHTPDRDIRAGSVTAITGRNGSGKTTLLKLLASILRPSNGSVNSSGNAFYLSADPTNTLVCDTVKAEIELGFLETGFQRNENLVSKIIEILRLDRLLNLHPRDLSFFQRYSVALASLAVLRPTMLLLDEPSRGAGEIGESALIELFNQLSSDCGTAVVIASNDRSFINGCTDEVIQLQ